MHSQYEGLHPAAPGQQKQGSGGLQLLTNGLHDDEIAGRLGVSIHTVRTHIHNIEGKLGARQRAELTFLAVRYGLIDPLKTSRVCE